MVAQRPRRLRRLIRGLCGPAAPRVAGGAVGGLALLLVLLRTAPAAAAAVGDGAPITAELAQQLYDRIAPVQAADGCRLTRFDTARFRITIGLRAPSGAEHELEVATAPVFGGTERRAGNWALGVPPALARDCAATIDAYTRALAATSAPERADWAAGGRGWWAALPASNHHLITVAFALLVPGTAWILLRELRAHPAAAPPALLLAAIWAAALALRLWLSPATFLHEYYHIADTVPGYLSGELWPVYGKTGPTLYRLAGLALGRADDVHVVFLTNAVLASLAIPAAALLLLAVTRSWPQALCGAVLLGVLPLHLRFSHAEDLFVVAITFALWALALGALYVRRQRLVDALCCACATSLATQARPEMVFFPGALGALWLFTAPGAWRLLFSWRTLGAALVLALLLVPRAFELYEAMRAGGPRPQLPPLSRYLDRLVLLRADVTPPVYWGLLTVGLCWGLVRQTGWTLWLLLVFVGWTLFSIAMFDNPPWNLRGQLLPTSLVILLGAAAAPVWLALWGRRRPAALALGAGLLAVGAAAVVVERRGFVTALYDQQLQWAFLERTIPALPTEATLLSAIDHGGSNLDAFPEFLLRSTGKRYRLVDVRRAARGDTPWPAPGPDVLYYQGMFCHFAFADSEPMPDPLTPTCQAVHDRYVLEPLAVEVLDVPGYSALRYAPPPYRIGFYRLVATR